MLGPQLKANIRCDTIFSYFSFEVLVFEALTKENMVVVGLVTSTLATGNSCLASGQLPERTMY